MIRTGIDIVEIARIEKAVKRHGGFLSRFFSEEECARFTEKKNAFERIAGHFAAKEAFSKFLGSGVRGFALKDIVIDYDSLGKPYLIFRGGKVCADLSISHTKTSAVAVVCGEEYSQNFSAEYAEYAALLPGRNKEANKGDCGRMFIVAGSRGMTGAACLCAMSAMRTGSGLVTVGVPESQQPVVACKITEAMTLSLPEGNGQLVRTALKDILCRLERSDVCVFGPGLGDGEDIAAIAQGILSQNKPVILDADGINAVSRNINILKERNCEVVLTPHPGEMSRLTGKTIAQIQAERVSTAVAFAKKYGVTVVLKGAGTVIAFPDGTFHINPTGNQGMATGGTGDVLAGVIGSLLGQGCSIRNAAVLGVFLHGYAGDLAAEDKGMPGMIASDVVEQLPYAIKNLKI